ncbi:MAG: hypothetical protein GY839_03665, partial [candidate division Zixibacteria bacterium]|nr:hypothetical protein [candidate division Zixibacteria bacterium]
TVMAGYSRQYTPGGIEVSADVVDNERFKVYKINKGDNQENPDWLNWPVDLGAPTDIDGKPLVLGDQTLWDVYNDVDSVLHSGRTGYSAPFGIEIQQTTFGFNRGGALANTIFLKFLIINKGNKIIEDTYISLWSDPDLGWNSDDLVGFDARLNLGYCYNATDMDRFYGFPPPAVGYCLLRGPNDDTGRELPPASFSKYNYGAEPRSPIQVYRYLQGLNFDGQSIIDPTTEQATKFNYPGDPISGQGWVDTDPADRRFLLNSGPFTFAPGDTQEITAAIIVARGENRLASLTELRSSAADVRDAFKNNFVLPSAEPIVYDPDVKGNKFATGIEIFIILLMIFLMIYVVFSLSYKEKRVRYHRLLPCSQRQMAMARISLVIILSLVMFALLAIVPYIYKT